LLALRIVYEDDFLVAVDKPAGFHSHAPEDKSVPCPHRWNALAILQNQVGTDLFPVHRLDRATSGLLLFSKQRAKNSFLQRQFQENTVEKSYLCLVRGHIPEPLLISLPLKNDSGEMLESRTSITPIFWPVLGRELTLLWARPHTGRFHQIRRHLAHISHPVVGDSQHGDRKFNREYFPGEKLFLRSMSLGLRHPSSDEPISLRVRWGKNWHALFDRVGFCPLPAVMGIGEEMRGH
jgi:tRNA pseudouridine65 synthase